MKKKITLIVALTFIVSALMMACGSSKKTLEQLINAENSWSEIEEACEQIVSSSNGVYRDASVEIKGNSSTYNFYFNDINMTDAEIKSMLEAQDYGSMCAELKEEYSSFEELDVEAITICLNFYSVDNALIFSYKN